MVFGEILRWWILKKKKQKQEEEEEIEETTPEEEKVKQIAEEHIREVERLYPAAEEIVKKAIRETGDETLKKLYEDLKEYAEEGDYAFRYMMVQLAAAIEKGLHKDKDKLFKFLLKAYHQGAKEIAEEVKDPQTLKQMAYEDKISNWTITSSASWKLVGGRILRAMKRYDISRALDAIKEDDIKHIAETIDMILRNYLDWWDKYTYEDLLELRDREDSSGTVEKSSSDGKDDRRLQDKIAEWLASEGYEVDYEHEAVSLDQSLIWALSVRVDKAGLPVRIYVRRFKDDRDGIVMGFDLSLDGVKSRLESIGLEERGEILFEVLKLAYMICPDCIVELQSSIVDPKSFSVIKKLYYNGLSRETVTSSLRRLVNILSAISAMFRLRLGISLRSREEG